MDKQPKLPKEGKAVQAVNLFLSRYERGQIESCKGWLSSYSKEKNSLLKVTNGEEILSLMQVCTSSLPFIKDHAAEILSKMREEKLLLQKVDHFYFLRYFWNTFGGNISTVVERFFCLGPHSFSFPFK